MRLRTKAIFITLSTFTVGLAIAQTYPQWWIDQNVVPSQPPTAPSASYDVWMAENYAVANLGQAKNLAAQAFNAMLAAQSGSAGAVIENMVSAFSAAPEDNYVPLTIGQLKALSAPFYDIMHAEDYPIVLADDTLVAKNTYPWIQDVTPDNLAIANLGQLKHVFSFDLSGWPPSAEPTTWEEIPDPWKQRIVDDPNSEFYDPNNLVNALADLLPDDDYDGDGISNYEEFLDGTDAADFFNGKTPTLYVSGGDGQHSPPDQFFDSPLQVHVLVNGEVALNAPLAFEELTAGASLGHSADEQSLTQKLYARTTSAGANAYYFAPSQVGESQVIVSMPVGGSAAFTFHVVSPESHAKPSISNFERVDHSDGSMTYSWNSEAVQGDWFKLKRLQSDGTWAVIYSTTYGSDSLPHSSESNSYTLTLDVDFNAIQ